MANPSQDPAAKLKPLVDQERRRQGPGHPSPEHISAYHDGQLAPDEADLLQQHLAFCPQCTQILLGLERFREDLAAEAAVADEDLPDPQQDEAWQLLRERIARDLEANRGKGRFARPKSILARPPVTSSAGAAGVATATVHRGGGHAPASSPFSPAAPTSPTSPTAPAAGSSAAASTPRDRPGRLVAYQRAVLLLAASLAACFVGSPLWVQHAVRQAESRGVAVNLPDKGVQRGADEAEIRLRLDAGTNLLVLPVATEQPYPTYRVEIFGAGATAVLAGNLLPVAGLAAPDANPTGGATDPGAAASHAVLSFHLLREQLPPGPYRVRISGLRDGADPRTLTESHLLILAP
jgi:hypothetical protein